VRLRVDKTLECYGYRRHCRRTKSSFRFGRPSLPWGILMTHALSRRLPHSISDPVQIRFSVACALGSFPNDPLSVRTLLAMMEDADGDVRDWATFGVGVLVTRIPLNSAMPFYRRPNDSDLDAGEQLSSVLSSGTTRAFCQNSLTCSPSSRSVAGPWRALPSCLE
jgi:hypothetical protein